MQHSVFKQLWFFHACLVCALYLFYAYLWIGEIFLYDGKAGWKGFGLFFYTLFTAPFYVFYHLCTLFMGYTRKDKQILVVSFVGIVLCAAHVIAVFSGV